MPPVGTAASAAKTAWAPKANAVLLAPGAGDKAGTAYGCACLKNCLCTSLDSCWCASDADKAPVGAARDLDAVKFNANSAGKKGSCVCSCGGVLGK